MGEYITGTGQKIVYVHNPDDFCRNVGCVIHNPSDHSMKDFPTNWRTDMGIMERICPHGIGHPDPDALRFRVMVFGEALNSYGHGCDGCCEDAYKNIPRGVLADSDWIANED